MATITDLDAKRVEMNNAIDAYKQAILDYQASTITLAQLNAAKDAASSKADEFGKLAGQVKKDNPGTPTADFFSNSTVQTQARIDHVATTMTNGPAV
jgi:hypothetical protein